MLPPPWGAIPVCCPGKNGDSCAPGEFRRTVKSAEHPACNKNILPPVKMYHIKNSSDTKSHERKFSADGKTYHEIKRANSGGREKRHTLTAPCRNGQGPHIGQNRTPVPTGPASCFCPDNVLPTSVFCPISASRRRPAFWQTSCLFRKSVPFLQGDLSENLSRYTILRLYFTSTGSRANPYSRRGSPAADLQ